MKKLFTLLSEKQVRLAPGQKVIPASEFSVLQEAHEILHKVQTEAAQYRLETAAEAEKVKESAFQEGFALALESLNMHILQLDKELKQIREEVHHKILPLALKAARKVVGEELKLHPDRIVDIVLNSLKPVTQHRKITIYVNRADLEALENHKSKIKEIFEKLENFSLQERSDIEPGGCIIETEAGIINAQLENQWRALESAFEAFKGKRSE
jgi:type III secretion protein L